MTMLLGQKQNNLVFKIHFWVTSIKREEFTYQTFALCSMAAPKSANTKAITFVTDETNKQMRCKRQMNDCKPFVFLSILCLGY